MPPFLGLVQPSISSPQGTPAKAGEILQDDHPALLGSLTPPETAETLRNFSPGPTCLPSAVEEKIKTDCFRQDTNDKTLSTIALSHRSPEFAEILEQARNSTRRVMEIPPEYEILFMQGGGHGQFAAVPLNLCPNGKEDIATYVVNGTWSERAVAEAKKYCAVQTVGKGMRYPTQGELEDEMAPDSKFVYVCSNETVNGIELHRLPRLSVPWVVDASSDFSSKPIAWREANVGVLFACASKNIGHPGVTLVVVRNDLLQGGANGMCPGILDYAVNARAGNVWNTAPTFNIHVVGIMMDWLAEQGGMDVMEDLAIAKSQLVYGAIEDSNGFYSTYLPASSGIRSRMNVPFNVAGGDPSVTDEFLVQAWNRGIVGLRTKTPFGGSSFLRASLYHGVPMEDVIALVDFMREFRLSR